MTLFESEIPEAATLANHAPCACERSKQQSPSSINLFGNTFCGQTSVSRRRREGLHAPHDCRSSKCWCSDRSLIASAACQLVRQPSSMRLTQSTGDAQARSALLSLLIVSAFAVSTQGNALPQLVTWLAPRRHSMLVCMHGCPSTQKSLLTHSTLH